MSYRLGIDLGTTFTAAAVCDVDTAVANPEVIPLGTHTAAVPSVVFVAEDGSFVFGDSAGRRCVTDPGRVIREFKRRIGDPIPIVVDGALYEPHVVAARFVRWVVDQVAERKGGLPDTLTVTHPAAWGEYKNTLFVDALRAENVGDVELMTEPEAAAIAYAADLKVEPGSTVAVYDLGGGTFDAAVVHGRERGRFEVVGAPEGLDALGGADFDEAIFEYVRARLAESWEGLDVTDASVLSAVAALRRECTEAKEALSSDTEVTIPVMLPGVHSQVRFTRGEFEEMIAAAIGETLEALRHALSSADVAAEDLAAVLLVGGSSRIPVIAQQLSEEFGRPVVADADPKSTVALGAALSGLAERAASGAVGATRVDLAPVTTTAVATLPAARGDDEVPAATTRRRRVAVLVAVLALALFGGAGTLAFDPFQSWVAGGARAATGMPGAVDERATADTSSSAASAESGAKIDPWTGKPYERTTTPGPDRAGATAAEGDFDATDPGPPPQITGGGGSQEEQRNDRSDTAGGSGTDGSQTGGKQDAGSDTTDGTQQGDDPAGDTGSTPSDTSSDEPDQPSSDEPPPSTSNPPPGGGESSSPNPTSESPASGDNSEPADGSTPPSESQGASSESSTGAASGTTG